MNTQKKGMTGKDIITVGIFSAIYFVINFAFMLLSGLHPLLWILMPGLIAVFAGIPFLMMCTKVPKTRRSGPDGLYYGHDLLCYWPIYGGESHSFCGELHPGGALPDHVAITGLSVVMLWPTCFSRWG